MTTTTVPTNVPDAPELPPTDAHLRAEEIRQAGFVMAYSMSSPDQGYPARLSQWTQDHIDTARAAATKLSDWAYTASGYLREREDGR